MHDYLTREQYTGAPQIAALETCVIRDSLDSMTGVCRWVPHEENPVYCITTLKGNAAIMLQTFRTPYIPTVGEADELEHRRKYRVTTGMKKHDPPYGKTPEH